MRSTAHRGPAIHLAGAYNMPTKAERRQMYARFTDAPVHT